MNLCRRCGVNFGSLTSFDKHQTWDYDKPYPDDLACTSPEALGLAEGPDHTWQTPKGLISRARGREWLSVWRDAQ